MGFIRGTHSSPGIYTKYTDVDKNGNKIVFKKSSLQSNSGGRGESSSDRYWVFGDMFPIIFS